jgi:mono/diheme cytochrome c family protein
VILCLKYPARVAIFLLFAANAAYPFSDANTKSAEQAGAVLYRDKGCPQCHGVDLAGNKKGPPLAEIRIDKAWPPERLTKQILDGGEKMPPFREALTDDEIAQLVAYLRAKDRPAPPPAAAPPASPSN